METFLVRTNGALNKKTSVYAGIPVLLIGFLIELVFVLFKSTNVLFLYYLGAIIIVGCSVLMETKHFFALFLFLIPSSIFFKLSNTGTAMLSYAALIFEAKYFLFNFKRIKIPLCFLAVPFLFVSTILFHDYGYIITITRSLILLLFLFIFASDHCLTKRKNTYILSFIVGVLSSITLGFLFYSMTSESVFNGMFSGLSGDRNYFASVVSVSISILVMSYSRIKNRLIFFVCFFTLLLGGFLSCSRTFLISLIWPFLALFLLLKNKTFRQYLLIGILAFTVVFLFFGSSIISIINGLIDRFGNETASDGNGRLLIWEYYVSYTINSPATIAFGCSNAMPPYINDFGRGIVQHNTFLEAFSEIGVVGIISLLLIFNSLRTKLSGKLSLASAIPLLSMFTCYFSLNALFTDTFTILLFVIFLNSTLCVSKNSDRV